MQLVKYFRNIKTLLIFYVYIIIYYLSAYVLHDIYSKIIIIFLDIIVYLRAIITPSLYNDQCAHVNIVFQIII